MPGFLSSRGDLIAFNDADDVWLQNSLREQVSILDAYPEVGLLAGEASTGIHGGVAKTGPCWPDMSRTRSISPPEALLSALSSWQGRGARYVLHLGPTFGGRARRRIRGELYRYVRGSSISWRRSIF